MERTISNWHNEESEAMMTKRSCDTASSLSGRFISIYLFGASTVCGVHWNLQSNDGVFPIHWAPLLLLPSYIDSMSDTFVSPAIDSQFFSIQIEWILAWHMCVLSQSFYHRLRFHLHCSGRVRYSKDEYYKLKQEKWIRWTRALWWMKRTYRHKVQPNDESLFKSCTERARTDPCHMCKLRNNFFSFPHSFVCVSHLHCKWIAFVAKFILCYFNGIAPAMIRFHIDMQRFVISPK